MASSREEDDEGGEKQEEGDGQGLVQARAKDGQAHLPQEGWCWRDEEAIVDAPDVLTGGRKRGGKTRRHRK